MAHSDGLVRPEHPVGVALADLISEFGLVGEGALGDVVIRGITMSSKDVQPGDLFAAVPGARVHGAAFAQAAVADGAVAILTDDAGRDLLRQAGALPEDFPVLTTAAVRAIVGDVAALVYGTAGLGIPAFAVTGTNGKTSVAYLLHALLGQLGIDAGLSSTAERRVGSHVLVSGLTTPEATELHALVARMREVSAQAIVLEVSAHALARHRVDGFEFDVAGFTNLSQDHFDDFVGFDDYFAAKARLFTAEHSRHGVIVVDDAWGSRLASESEIPVVTLASATEVPADWHVAVTSESLEATAFELNGPQGEHLASSVPLLGGFMATNAALAIVMLVESGIPFGDIARALARDGGVRVHVPGRAQLLSGAEGPAFYVDYGHTPEAFRSLLAALRKVTPGKVIMVFGADGDRDTSKRPAMGEIAAQGADVVIITDFHPRSEDPALIRAALLEGAHHAQAEGSAVEVLEVPDPLRAVRTAIALASAGDSIMYAGPGHEDYREVAGVKLPYDAREDVRAALREAGFPPRDEETIR
jgi:UDP-N-acetylmuramoyl-L-alanyl-D-glutamate--2,6-diaminopimelate ligase